MQDETGNLIVFLIPWQIRLPLGEIFWILCKMQIASAGLKENWNGWVIGVQCLRRGFSRAMWKTSLWYLWIHKGGEKTSNVNEERKTPRRLCLEDGSRKQVPLWNSEIVEVYTGRWQAGEDFNFWRQCCLERYQTTKSSFIVHVLQGVSGNSQVLEKTAETS